MWVWRWVWRRPRAWDLRSVFRRCWCVATRAEWEAAVGWWGVSEEGPLQSNTKDVSRSEGGLKALKDLRTQCKGLRSWVAGSLRPAGIRVHSGHRLRTQHPLLRLIYNYDHSETSQTLSLILDYYVFNALSMNDPIMLLALILNTKCFRFVFALYRLQIILLDNN